MEEVSAKGGRPVVTMVRCNRLLSRQPFCFFATGIM